jgi:hypothetical protein
MRLLRPPNPRAVKKWLVPCVAVLALVVTGPAMAETPFGRTGLPSSWIGEALMVSLAFALPAIIAGMTIALRRVFARQERRDAFRPRL